MEEVTGTSQVGGMRTQRLDRTEVCSAPIPVIQRSRSDAPKRTLGKEQVSARKAQPSPHSDATIALGRRPVLDTASANFCINGMSRCSGMLGISS